MDKQKTDKWLRESLRGYQPTPGRKGREAFLEAAAGAGKAASPKTNFSGLKTGMIVLLFLLILAAVFIFLRQPSAEFLPQPDNTEILSLLNTDSIPPASNHNESSQSATLNHFTPDAAVAAEKATSTNSVVASMDKHLVHQASTENQPESEPATSQPEENLLFQPTYLPNDTAPTLSLDLDQKSQREVENEDVMTSDTTIAVGESPGEDAGEKLPQENDPIPHRVSYKKGNEWYVYYRPEMIYNIIENNKLIHNVGVDYARRFFNDKYSLRVGLALSLSKGHYEYATEYNEYLGSFRKLDSVTFAWDQQQYNLVPTVYTSQAEAYDDAVQTTYAKIYKQHVYLLVPMMLGYDFVRNNNWRMGLRAGPRLAVLVNTKKLTYLPDIGRNKLIQINQITPDRIKTNWQIAAGFSFAVQTKKLIFEIEPGGVYYFNSVYETPNIQKAPWSLSLRLAVGFVR